MYRTCIRCSFTGATRHFSINSYHDLLKPSEASWLVSICLDERCRKIYWRKDKIWWNYLSVFYSAITKFNRWVYCGDFPQKWWRWSLSTFSVEKKKKNMLGLESCLAGYLDRILNVISWMKLFRLLSQDCGFWLLLSQENVMWLISHIENKIKKWVEIKTNSFVQTV